MLKPLATRSGLPTLLFCVIQEVLELSEGVWTLVDRTLLIFNPLTEHAFS
jgi:hypothetical protein